MIRTPKPTPGAVESRGLVPGVVDIRVRHPVDVVAVTLENQQTESAMTNGVEERAQKVTFTLWRFEKATFTVESFHGFEP